MESFFERSYPNTGTRGAFALTPSGRNDLVRLDGIAPKIVPVPAGAAYVSFTADADFFAKFGNATVSALVSANADYLDGSAPEYCPGIVKLPANATHVSVYAESTAKVSLAWYAA